MKPIILHMDTTTSRLFIGVSQDDQLLASECIPCESHRYHSAIIVPAIQDMLSKLSLSAKALQGLAVNIGPGSFTGIRTGLITARTMAQFLRLPVYAFNAFEILAAEQKKPVTVMIDALRGRAYTATLALTNDTINYQADPRLIQLNPTESGPPDIPPDTSILASPTLLPLLPETQISLLPEDFQSPQAMLSLIRRYGPAFERSWQSVKPLYIQEPSITIRKKTPQAY